MRYNINNKSWDALNNKNWDLNLNSNIQCFPRRYKQIFFLLFSPHRISQTNDQFDQLKLEKKHKKAVAREDEYAKVNVERTTLGVVSMLSYPHHARPVLPRRSSELQTEFDPCFIMRLSYSWVRRLSKKRFRDLLL